MKKFNGILYVILSSTFFGIIPILAKIAYGSGANADTTLFLRFAFAIIILLCYFKFKHISIKLGLKEFCFVMLLGALGYSIMSLLLFASYNYMDVGVASMIIYVYPTIVTILSAIIYKEKISLRKVICLIISVIGIVVIIDLGGNKFSLKGTILVLLAALSYSCYVLGASSKTVRSIDSFVMSFYVSLASAIAIGIKGAICGNLNFNIGIYGIGAILLLAIISTVIALMLFLKGVKIIGPSNASIFGTLEPIVGMVLGVLVLGEAITINKIMGSVLIILSMVLLAKE